MSIATHMVAMRDGVRLATDVYLPDGAGPFPVIMERTPYGRERDQPHRDHRRRPHPGHARRDRRLLHRAWLRRGLPGHARPLWLRRPLREIPVGRRGRLRRLRLAARSQPWCDGRICTMGLSYAAHTQAALGCLDPPGLVAQVLDCGGFANSWKSGIRQSGAFELKQATWAFKKRWCRRRRRPIRCCSAALAAEDVRDWFTRMPWKPGHSPLRHHPDYEAYLFDQWTHGADEAVLAAARHLDRGLSRAVLAAPRACTCRRGGTRIR